MLLFFVLYQQTKKNSVKIIIAVQNFRILLNFSALEVQSASILSLLKVGKIALIS
jgi:hypothetical protein